MKQLLRTVMLVGLSGGMVLAPSPLTAARAEVRCCLPVVIPGVVAEQRCTTVVLHTRRRSPSARRLCRLVGGHPLSSGGGCTCA